MKMILTTAGLLAAATCFGQGISPKQLRNPNPPGITVQPLPRYTVNRPAVTLPVPTQMQGILTLPQDHMPCKVVAIPSLMPNGAQTSLAQQQLKRYSAGRMPNPGWILPDLF